MATGSDNPCLRRPAPTFFAQDLRRGSQDAGMVRAAGAALTAPRDVHARLLRCYMQG